MTGTVSMTMSSAENSPVHASKAAGRSWSSSNDAATKMASPLCVPSSLYTTVTFSTTIFEFTVRAAISSCAPTHMRYSTISGASVCCTRGTSFGCASPRVRPSAAPSRHPSRTASQVLKKSSRGQNSIVMADGSCSFFCDNCPSDNVTVYNCAQPSKPGRRVESRMTGASSASRASAEGAFRTMQFQPSCPSRRFAIWMVDSWQKKPESTTAPAGAGAFAFASLAAITRSALRRRDAFTLRSLSEP